VAATPQTVRLRGLGLTARFAAGDGSWTESSKEFTREATEAMLDAAGLRLDRWHTDARRRFAVVVAGPVGGR
jgi:L-histidine N-alpha-methyltransferase